MKQTVIEKEKKWAADGLGNKKKSFTHGFRQDQNRGSNGFFDLKLQDHEKGLQFDRDQNQEIIAFLIKYQRLQITRSCDHKLCSRFFFDQHKKINKN